MDPTEAEQRATLVTALTEEYKAAKTEQNHRIALRDGLVYTTIAASVAATVASAGRPALLLALPLVCVVLGWTYLMADRTVSAIGAYLRDDFRPRLAELAGAAVLGWEVAHRSDRRRRQRKSIQLAVDLTVFVAPAIAALVTYWTGPVTPPLLAASIAEAGLVALIAWQIVVYADRQQHQDTISKGI